MISAGGARVIALLGIGLVLWTGRVLGWRRLLWLSDAPPSPALPYLVLGGPYRYVRHPCFVGIALTLVAAAARRGTALAWLACALGVGALVAVARFEERRLRARHGEAYARYQGAVPFMLPRLR